MSFVETGKPRSWVLKRRNERCRGRTYQDGFRNDTFGLYKIIAGLDNRDWRDGIS